MSPGIHVVILTGATTLGDTALTKAREALLAMLLPVIAPTMIKAGIRVASILARTAAGKASRMMRKTAAVQARPDNSQPMGLAVF
jgi:hypothetical protein